MAAANPHPKVAAMVAALTHEGDVVLLPKEKYLAWQDELARPELRSQHRIFYDCLTVGLSLYKEGLLTASWQFLLLSAIGLQSAEALEKLREGGADPELVERFKKATSTSRRGTDPPPPSKAVGVGLRGKRR